MPDHPLPAAQTAMERWGAMLLMRRFEERSVELYGQGLIGGFLHRARGEEAVVAGAAGVLDPGDAVLSTFRSGAWALARGTPPGAVMAELMGRVGGVCGGIGGSTHVVDAARGVLGGFGIPGGHTPVAAGVALTGRLALCQMPMGATTQGVVSETWALAAAWGVPVVFLVTRDAGAPPPLTELFARGASLGVAGLRCDGTDVLAVEAVVGDAVARARAERRPLIVEALVDREGADPVARFGERLEAGVRDAVEARVSDLVMEAVSFARASPEATVAAS